MCICLFDTVHVIIKPVSFLTSFSHFRKEILAPDCLIFMYCLANQNWVFSHFRKEILAPDSTRLFDIVLLIRIGSKLTINIPLYHDLVRFQLQLSLSTLKLLPLRR